MIDVPQLDMQPLTPGAEVPGAPVLDLEGVQKSGVMPHWPQISHYQVELGLS
jgi:hypothetical protein